MNAWSDERVDMLLGLFRGGKTFTIIAKLMGISRGAVSGKLDRLGEKKTYDGAPRRIRQRELYAVNKPFRPFKPPRPTPKSVPLPDCEPVGLMALTMRSCRWPINDPKPGEDWLFCNAHAPLGGPYCAYHSRMALNDRRAA